MSDSPVPAFLAHLPVPPLSRQIARDRQPDWSRVAAHCGYYDQSHLVHEFRRLSGLTPSEYVATRLPDFNHAIVA